MAQDAQDIQEQINKVMNRLRAQLYNTIEQMGFDDSRCNAYKQTVKDVTSDAWNSITRAVVSLKNSKKE